MNKPPLHAGTQPKGDPRQELPDKKKVAQLPPLDPKIATLYQKVARPLAIQVRQRLATASRSVVQQLVLSHGQKQKLGLGHKSDVMGLVRSSIARQFGHDKSHDKGSKEHLQYVVSELILAQYKGGGTHRGYGQWAELLLDFAEGKTAGAPQKPLMPKPLMPKPLPGTKGEKGEQQGGSAGVDEGVVEIVRQLAQALEKLRLSDQKTLHLAF